MGLNFKGSAAPQIKTTFGNNAPVTTSSTYVSAGYGGTLKLSRNRICKVDSYIVWFSPDLATIEARFQIFLSKIGIPALGNAPAVGDVATGDQVEDNSVVVNGHQTVPLDVAVDFTGDPSTPLGTTVFFYVCFKSVDGIHRVDISGNFFTLMEF